VTPGLVALRLAWSRGGLRGPVLIALAALLASAYWETRSQGYGSGHHHAVAGGLQCASIGLFEWMLMVVAMMTPLLVPTINHVWHSSLARRRFDALLALGLGYGVCWALAGMLLMPVAALWGQGWTRAFAVLAASIAWSCSPISQYARNRCHRVRGIHPFGLAADRDSFVQGLAAGAPCVLACWPWMLVPMSVPAGHAVLTLAVTLVLFLERLDEPRKPAWRTAPALTVLRLLSPRWTGAWQPAGQGGIHRRFAALGK